MGAFSLWQWLVVLAVVLILFARPGKISGIMGDFGKGLKNFKKGMKDGDASDEAPGVSDEAADAVYIEEGDEPAPTQTAVRAKKTTAKKTAKKSAAKKKTSNTAAAKKTAPKNSAKK
jgi:sec-independent protein translocase protein TatA